MTATADLVIREQALHEVERVLDAMIQQAQAKCALLINRDNGSLIAARGLVHSLDTTSLAALAAGTFASAREIARLIGEPEFSVLFHQGRHAHVHVNVAGEHALVMVLFDDLTTVGMVRLCARDASGLIDALLSSPGRAGNAGSES